MTTIPTSLEAALAGRYTLERPLGSGGMATVYLATDVRHGRRVAVKVLRPELASLMGPARFLQEIRTTAALQHPHIVPLHDSGEADGTVFYVMPYIAGESLRDRLHREGQLPVADAVRITREVADALDYAHRQGLLHRDIKPENILLHENRALIADFGIALALSRSGADARLTESGMSLGTPQYMSPEQAMGERTLTARTDVYALGAVLYEMLAGEPPFTGPTAQAIVAKTMSLAPVPVRELRKSVPDHVEAAIHRALEKLPADRFATVAEFAAAVEGTAPAGVATMTRPAARRPSAPGLIAAGGLLFAVAIVATALVTWALARRAAPPATTARAMIPLAPNQLLSIGFDPLDISPDGTQLVYVGVAGGQSRLFLRALADSAARLLAGTEGAGAPFFSPDGEWIGFFAGGKLKKVPRRGGAPVVITNAPTPPRGASWGEDESIVYSLGGTELYRVRGEGAEPVVITATSRELDGQSGDSANAAGYLRWPELLPGGRRALITSGTGIGTTRVGVIDLETGEVRPLFAGQQARYLPTGHLIYDDNEGRIRVVGFDLRGLTVTGASVPAFEAFRGPGGGSAYFAVSETGTLVYMAGGFQRSLVRVDRYGRETPIAVEPRGYRFPKYSPDGSRVAVTVDPRPSSIWLVDPARGSAVPLTTAGIHSILPIWAADGSRIAFAFFRLAPGESPAFLQQGVSWMPVAGGADPRPALITPAGTTRGFVNPFVWTRDDRFIATETRGASWDQGSDIITFGLGDSAKTRIVSTGARNRGPALSPDGRWLAYASDISGALEIYVRPFDRAGEDVLVSSGGGVEPRWAAGGTELFYRSGTRIMAVPVRTRPEFEVTGPPQALFSGAYDWSQDDNWDVAPNGGFILVKGDPASGTQLRVVFNWLEEVKALSRK